MEKWYARLSREVRVSYSLERFAPSLENSHFSTMVHSILFLNTSGETALILNGKSRIYYNCQNSVEKICNSGEKIDSSCHHNIIKVRFLSFSSQHRFDFNVAVFRRIVMENILQ